VRCLGGEAGWWQRQPQPQPQPPLPQQAVQVPLNQQSTDCCSALQIPSQPLYPSYFQRRSIYISRQQSAQIVAGLKKIGAINEDGWLNYDPRMVSCCCCC
jgi:hypothetical protein